MTFEGENNVSRFWYFWAEEKIRLKSSDGETFEVEKVVAKESQIIKHMIEDNRAYNEIPLPNVSSEILSKVLKYCKKHVDTADAKSKIPDHELKAWDAGFVEVDQNTLLKLIQAADYLDIESLSDLTRQTFADMINCKTLEEIRKTFNIFTQEELLRLVYRTTTSKSPFFFLLLQKKIRLKSSDGETFEVEEVVAMQSQTIKHMIEDNCANNEIPLPNVTSKILSKVLEYCKKHVDAAYAKDKIPDDELKAWDAEFVKVDQNTLFDLILAANYLHIKSLFDLTCQTVADMIKGKTPVEIRKTFSKNDVTSEEEEEVMRENQWAFE